MEFVEGQTEGRARLKRYWGTYRESITTRLTLSRSMDALQRQGTDYISSFASSNRVFAYPLLSYQALYPPDNDC